MRDREALAANLGRLALLALLLGMQLAFWPAAEDPFTPLEVAWIKVLAPLALLPLLLSPGQAWARLRQSPAAWAVAAFCAWLFASAAFGAFPRQGLKTALEYAVAATLFLAGAHLDEAGRRRAVAALLAGCLLAAAYGLAQHFGLDFQSWNTNFDGRPLGTIGNPNFFAGHLVVAWALALGLLLASRPGRARRWLAAGFGLLTLVQAFSLTVGAWLGMAAAALLALAWTLGPGAALLARWGLDRRKVALALAAALLLAAGLAALPPVRAAWRGFSQGKQVSVVNRTLMWKTAVDMWRDKPATGLGLGSYRPLFPDYQARILARDSRFTYVVTWLPHENHLYWLAETGLVGLGLFAAALGLGLAQGWRRLVEGRGIELGAALAVLAMQAEGLLNTYSNIPPTAAALWFLLGLLAFAPAAPRPQAGRAAGGGRAAWALGLALALSAALGVFTLAQVQANRLLKEANRLKRQSDPSVSLPLYAKVHAMDVTELVQQAIVGSHYDQGEAHRELGQLDKAREQYQADLAENPHTPETHNMLGAVLGQMNRPAEAAGHLERAVALSPGYTAALLNLGISRVQMGNVTGAAQAWQRVLELEPDNAQARQYLAQAQAMQRKAGAGKR